MKKRSYYRIYLVMMASMFLHIFWVVLVVMFKNTKDFAIVKPAWILMIAVSAGLQVFLMYRYAELIDIKNEIAESVTPN